MDDSTDGNIDKTTGDTSSGNMNDTTDCTMEDYNINRQYYSGNIDYSMS